MNLLFSLHTRRDLFLLLVRRQIQQQFKGSYLGIGWMLITPAAMVAVFSLIFGSVIPVKWASINAEAHTSQSAFFIVNLFCGMVPYYFFSELMNGTVSAIVSRPNFVKKIVFPLELLPLVDVCAASANLLVFVTILIVVAMVFGNGPVWHMLLIPLLLAPYVLLLAGLAMFLSSMTVYFRDLRQLISPIVLMMMFLSPVFYPMSTLPDWLAGWMVLNPLAFVIEGLRGLVFGVDTIDKMHWLLYSLVAVAVFFAGLKWFIKIRPGFADLL